MKIVELDTPSEHIERVISMLSDIGSKEYLLMLSGGNSPKQLYNHMSFSFTYPFPMDVGMVDERWGEFSQHSRSNELIIKNTGLMGRIRWEQSNFHSILSPKPTYPDDEAASYELELLKLFDIYKDKVVAVLGMGVDGHIAGILPESPAVESEKNVAAYDSDDEFKQRITVTIKCIMESFSKIILLLDTEEKCGVFNKIMRFESSVNKHPVLSLKNLKDVTVFCYTEK